MGWRSREMQATGWRSRQPIGLGDPLVDVKTQFQADLNAKLGQLSDSARAQVMATTGIDVNGQAAAGAAATADLVTNGYNPDNPSDNAKLVHAISGGLALIPGVGPLLGGAVEVLWTVGNQIACPVTHLFGGTSPSCGDPPCVSTGNWMPSTILSGSLLPSYAPDSFGRLVTSALAVQAANAANCKGSVTPDHVVDAIVAMWNDTHAGPRIDVFVAPLNANQVPFPILAAFGPLALSAFLPIDQTDPAIRPVIQQWVANGASASPFDASQRFFAEFTVQTVSWATPLWSPLPARIVRINSGALLPNGMTAEQAFAAGIAKLKTEGMPDAQWAQQTPAQQAAWRSSGIVPQSEKQASGALSTGAKVAVGTAAVVGATAAGIGLYAALHHAAFSSVAKMVWKKTGGVAVDGVKKIARRK